ncbi:MAG: DUF1616 domain-containing protein [Anaerolineae bacterium]|nr:DUF1616 domain-containing protein [Anaerolineae bacterium]
MIKFKIRNEFLIFAVVGLILLALIAAGIEGVPALLPMIRLLLGLAFVLFMPGYALQAALFPRREDLDGPERLALAFSLSIAVAPPLALLLDQLPWGITLWPIFIGEALVTGLFSGVAWWRRRRLPLEERLTTGINLDLRGWWAAQDRTNRILYSVLAGALVLALVSAIAILVGPAPGDFFTEFYVLGSEGLAENYPRETAVGDPVTVTAGITNREGTAITYRIEIQVEGALLSEIGPVALDHGQTWEQDVVYALPEAGDDQVVDFFLYREGDVEPYRSLRLWINVLAAKD